jgi:hypothetical protein
MLGTFQKPLNSAIVKSLRQSITSRTTFKPNEEDFQMDLQYLLRNNPDITLWEACQALNTMYNLVF